MIKTFCSFIIAPNIKAFYQKGSFGHETVKLLFFFSEIELVKLFFFSSCRMNFRNSASLCFSSSGRFLYCLWPYFRFFIFVFLQKISISFTSIITLFLSLFFRKILILFTSFYLKPFSCFFCNIQPTFSYIGNLYDKLTFNSLVSKKHIYNFQQFETKRFFAKTF